MSVEYSAGAVVAYMPVSTHITTEVKQTLITGLAAWSVYQLLETYPTPVALIEPLQQALPHHTDTLGAIAIELHSYLSDMVVAYQPPLQTAVKPHECRRTPLDELPLGELLRRLNAKDDNQRLLLDTLWANGDVRAALQKTRAAFNTDAIVVPNTNGGIDVDATVAYIEHIVLPFGQLLYRTGNVYPTSIEEALGLTRMVMFNFITRDIVYVGQADKFGLGLVFSNLPEKVIKAGLWGLATNHPFMFRSDNAAEQAQFFGKLFTDVLPFEMQRVLEDYERAIASSDMTARSIVCEAPEKQAEQLVRQLGDTFATGEW